MTIILTKKAAILTAEPAAETPIPAAIAALIEEVGALQDDAEAAMKQIKALQAKLKPYAEKVKILANLVTSYAASQGLGPDDEITEATENFVLQVGKAGTLRTVIDVELAMKRMGKKIFFEKATIGLGVIDQYLTPGEKDGVVRVDRVTRSVRVARQ